MLSQFENACFNKLNSYLTVASFLGNFLPRGSFLTIILKGDMLAQECSQGLLLKFQDGTFDAIKSLRKKILREFHRMYTGNLSVLI